VFPNGKDEIQSSTLITNPEFFGTLRRITNIFGNYGQFRSRHLEGCLELKLYLRSFHNLWICHIGKGKQKGITGIFSESDGCVPLERTMECSSEKADMKCKD
jgi:hypothetical protein